MVYKGYLQVQKHMQKVSLASGERVTKVSETKTEKRPKKGSTLSEIKKMHYHVIKCFFLCLGLRCLSVFIWSLWQLIKPFAESYEMWHTVRGHSQH